MIVDSLYHIYVNDVCVANCLNEEEFKKEFGYIKAFLELTNLDKGAKVDYVRCEPPNVSLVDGSY